MKSCIKVFLLICLFSALSQACQKNSSASTSTKPILTLSKQTVKIGEPLVAGNAANLDVFTRWSVNPPANSSIIPNGNQSVILFSQAGSYSVTATYFADSAATTPYDSSSSPVTVTDSIYNDSAIAYCNSISQVPLLAGDLITMTPISYSDTGLVLLVHTQDLYGSNYPGLGFLQANPSGTTFSFGFDVVTEAPCLPAGSGPMPATGSVSFYNLSSGTYTIAAEVSNINYQGTLVVSPTECTFTWDYSSGVVISPLTIQKQ